MRLSATLLLVLTLCACRGSPTDTGTTRVNLDVLGDAVVYAAADGAVADPLRVVVVHAGTGAVQRNIDVSWQVTQGSGGVNPAASRTDEFGVATTWPVAGAVGTFRVSATAASMQGATPSVEVRVVPRPTIADIQPAVFAAGEQVTITGSNFSPTAGENGVYFDGVPGRVVTATATELRVEVPACLPARPVAVRAGLGGVLSAVRPATSSGGTVIELSLAPGQVHVTMEAAALGCTRLTGSPNAQYLITVHNGSGVFSPRRAFQVRTLATQPVVAATLLERAPRSASYAHDWELQLRQRERDLGAVATEMLPELRYAAAVGDRRQFNVLDRDYRFVQTTAEARHISSRAVIYVDVEAIGAFSAGDLQSFGAVFDDPIYATNVAAFGEPSDLDGNQRIIILFTPKVNALTPRGQGSSYIAGYFYGCDLVSRAQCSGSNGGEIFYSIVPDPAGTWSDARSHANVMNAMPPVLAHEFQHMIHFARRGFSTDVLWLSEALAHTAEELVADVFAARGQTATESVFRLGNLLRAQLYLIDPGAASLVGIELPGSLQLRGAGWLFLKYLRGHYGGNELLRGLTGSANTGAANVAQQTNQPWNRLVTDFGVAIFADGAPTLQGPLPQRYRFMNFNLRQAVSALSGGYPLQPTTGTWGDVFFAGELPSAAHEHFLFSAGSSSSDSQPLTLIVGGRRGVALTAQDDITLSIVRLR
jgi:hypothetical protein